MAQSSNVRGVAPVLTPGQYRSVADGSVFTPSNQLVVTLGDSLQAIGFGLSALNLSTFSVGAINWGCALLKQALWVPIGASAGYLGGPPGIVNYALAVSGTTTQDVIAAQVPRAKLLRANWWSVQIGTNDLTLLAGDSYISICRRIEIIVREGLENGVKVILWTIPPRAQANWLIFGGNIVSKGSTIARQKQKQMAVNAWMRRFAQETPGVVLVDPYNELVDPANADGGWKVGYSTDGIHWNSAGAYIAGRVFAATLAPFVKPAITSTISLTDTYSAIDNPSGDLAVNRGCAGTGGTLGAGVTGTAPDSWTVDAQLGTFTAVAAAQARTDAFAPGVPSNGRELSIAVSTASAGAQLRAYQMSIGAAIPAGVPFFCEMEIAVTANSAAWAGPSMQVFFNSGAVNTGGMLTDGSALPVGATFEAVIRTPICRADVASGGLVFSQMNLLNASAVTMAIRRLSIRPVDTAAVDVLLGRVY
jgi:lysophospholipase L1-like esterase